MSEEAEEDGFQKVLDTCMRNFAQAVAESTGGFVVEAANTPREQFRNAVGHLLSLDDDVARLEAHVVALGTSLRGDSSVGLVEYVRSELHAEIQQIARQE